MIFDINFYNSIYTLYTADPIDCESDICHLAWIIRDHRHLLKALFDGAYCLNGTELKDLILKDGECFNSTTVSTTATSMLIVKSQIYTQMFNLSQLKHLIYF